MKSNDKYDSLEIPFLNQILNIGDSSIPTLLYNDFEKRVNN